MAGCKDLVRQMAGLTLANGRSSMKLWSRNLCKRPYDSGNTLTTAINNNAGWNTNKQHVRWSSFFTMNQTTTPQIESNTTSKEENETDAADDFSFAMDSNLPKLKPHIVQRRLSTLRTYEGGHKQFRHSPWRLNLVCHLAARCATLEESIGQVAFSGKQKSKGLVLKVLQRTANLADIRDCLQPSQLEVAQCFATQGKHLKRLKFMAKGRTGIMHHKFSNMRVVLREIDFPLKVYQAPTMAEKRLWLERYKRAKRQFGEALQQREELERLEKAAKERQEKERGKK